MTSHVPPGLLLFPQTGPHGHAVMIHLPHGDFFLLFLSSEVMEIELRAFLALAEMEPPLSRPQPWLLFLS